MHAHNFLVNKGDQGHVIEAGVELLPKVNFVPSFDLIEEPINPGNGLALVITSEDDDRVWEANLQSQQEADYLTALLATVDIVSHEEVAGVFGDNVVLLFGLVLVAHLLEHVDQV